MYHAVLVLGLSVEKVKKWCGGEHDKTTTLYCTMLVRTPNRRLHPHCCLPAGLPSCWVDGRAVVVVAVVFLFALPVAMLESCSVSPS